jgi:hypothetical protein
MSGYDELERRLRESVRALGASEAPDAGAGAPDDGRGRAARWWARGGRRGVAVAVAAVVVVGGGVATAAQLGVVSVAHHDGARLSARQVASQAVVATQDERACRRMDPSSGSKIAAVALDRRLRDLLAGGTPAAEGAARGIQPGAVIVAGSAHVVPLGRGRSVVLFATVGQGPMSLADPAACGAARLAWLTRDRPDPGSPLRQKAEAVLRTFRDTIPGLQMLEVMLRRSDRGAGGTGIPLAPGDPVPVGIVSGSSDGTYLGLSRAGAVRVTADAPGLHRSFAVHRRVYVVTLPRHGTGPVRLRQRAADGRVVHVQTIR